MMTPRFAGWTKSFEVRSVVGACGDRWLHNGRVSGLGALLTAVVVTGCSHSTQESQVAGNVTLDGASIGVGTIVYVPVGGGKPATGSIEADGSYFVNTSRELGMAPGTYAVTVSIREMPKNVKRSDHPPPGKLLIPQRYEQSSTSGLQFEVAPGNNTIDIELTSS